MSDITVSPFNLSIFDNAAGGSGKGETTACGLILSIDADAMTATLKEYIPSFNNTAGEQGSVQPLENGNVVIGWGAQPYYSEHISDGTLIHDVHFGALNTTVQSYRAFKMAWTGNLTTTPDFAINSTGFLTAYASWNGATEVATWELLGGDSVSSLVGVSNTSRTGFETEMSVSGSHAYLLRQL